MSQFDAEQNIVAIPRNNNYLAQPWAVQPLIRRSSLYFDKIVVPVNNLYPLEPAPGLEYMIGEGRLEMPSITVPVDSFQLRMFRNAARPGALLTGVNSLVDAVARFHRDVFIHRDSTEDAAWCFTSVGNGLDFDNDERYRGFSVELYNALPVPSDSVSYKDIVAFTKKNREALITMRAVLDEMYDRIVSSGDPHRTALNQRASIEKSIAAVQKLLNESHIAYVLRSLTIDFTGKNVVGAAHEIATAIGAAGGTYLSLSKPLAGAATVAAMMVLKAKDIRWPSTRAGAFKYLYSAGDTGIIDLPGPPDPGT